jgi:hypothetical protein
MRRKRHAASAARKTDSRPAGRTGNPELWWALVAIVVTTALYALAYRQNNAFPRASGLVGHGIGIVGFILMLMTATLYPLRKLSTNAGWGSMQRWLRFHMFTGLVGPYMVLLHTSMRFHGLAAVAMLLTVVAVISGIVGRYIYTRAPRVVAGAEPGPIGLDPRFAHPSHPVAAGVEPVLAVSSSDPAGMAVAFEGATATVLEAAPPVTARSRQTAPAESDRRLGALLRRRGTLATWRSFHVPLTWALFVAAVVHMIAALYYKVW